MKYKVLVAVVFFLISAQCFVFAQEDVKAKHEAYYLCINTMEKEPPKAYQFCSEYLKKYPNDDARLVEFARKWLVSYEKISRYLNSTEPFFAAELGQTWAVYLPDLEKRIPIVSDKDDSHKIEIVRNFNSPSEDKLLSKAEAVYRNPQELSKELNGGWRYLSERDNLPEGEPKWWAGYSDTILSAEIVTTGAVLYYFNISKKLQKNPKLNDPGFTFSRTELKYDSSIKKFDKFERSGKVFNNVYVADLNLTWAQVCGGLCGHGFTRNKVVVLGEKGNILEMFLDAPVNRSSWVS
ncbi:MAG TPA: hypothetical protein VF648_19500 [Pyrinomonadaceae bacterium]|jgi:hypothetical protein